MKISGFSFVRNAQKLYYPVAESIRSILPICDEFIIAVGKGDSDDRSREEIEAVGDKKIRIIDTVWSDRERLKGNIHGQQTNIALQHCSGDWCFYLQADEVVHEKYLAVIKRRCEQLLEHRQVQGLIFDYKHFWGDYDHYQVSHAWYPREIRIIRNNIGIESWQSAQSFRLNGSKLRVARANAEIFHYGWVRPPHLMNKKRKEFSVTHKGKQWANNFYRNEAVEFNYGSLASCLRYLGTHPSVMNERVAKCDWKDKLLYEGKSPVKHKHDKFKYRFLTFIEQKILGGRQLGGFKNYILVKK